MIRLRRLRSTDVIRDMVRETVITKNDLVYPVFVKEGENEKIPVDSMPGIYQYTIDRFDEELDRIKEAGIPAILIFGIPEHKDECGSQAYDENGITQRAIRHIKEKAPELVVIADVCLCEYTS
ncbi:MAG: porphobilinogen synthase, partial [Lachnospiraceae bacterium]|nr:porphobilinogen synthase [Lachnospiraceae bacterium]